jgi:ATP-dependent Lon protease
LSYVRAHAESLSIDPDFYENSDLHLHIPAGAQPKDGPSAGVTMVSALVSLLTNRTIRSNIGMTGEISLRGQVLPVGGIKEKVLAAHQAGLDTIILPEDNRPDLDELSEEVRNSIKFIFADTVEAVLKAALDLPEDHNQKE